MLRVGVLVSGGGTNLQAILDAIDAGTIRNAKVEVVISNNAGAFALERAKKHGIPAECLSPKDFASREEFNEALVAKIDSYELDLIVLAGYLVKIPAAMIEKYRDKIINIHPSLIPSFCGVGFYGLKVHEAALRRGVKITGATVHFVDEGMDSGPIILHGTGRVEDPAEGHRHDRKRRDLIQDRRQPFLAARGVYRNGFTDKQEEKRMKVLIVGSGGREHAIAWKVAQSKKVDKIYCAPGNAGISEVAECVPIGAMEFDKLVAFAKEKEIDLTVIGMDDPLVGGIVDVFEKEGLRVFGPRKNAAILEGSKAFSKDLMKKYNIPTAAYETFTDPEKALEYLETAKMPIVLKADGLALGKGVLICQTLEEAKEGVKTLMMDKKFGSAGDEIVIEEFMTGREVSVLSFVDGNIVKIMSSAQDHKRAKDGDQGLNTGGMGNFSPSPFYTKEVDEFCKKYIYQPTVDAMAAEGRPFKGVIFFGLMLTPDGPKVLEYNARFGDPEAQVVLPRLENDIVDVFEACIDGTLDQVDLKFDNDRATVCVILASDGYPVEYKKGFPIEGLEKFKGKDDYYVFHSGTKFNENGQIVTNGGRVLGVTATGKDLKEARKKAYEATEWISFENKYMRHDIGKAIEEA